LCIDLFWVSYLVAVLALWQAYTCFLCFVFFKSILPEIIYGDLENAVQISNNISLKFEFF